MKTLKTKVVAVVSVAVAALILPILVWHFYRYDTTILSLTYEANPIISSPLSGASYSWEAKAYGARIFGNSPFAGEGYVHRERIMSENRFRNTEFHNLNVSLKLRFEITNGTGYVLCNKTLDSTDGCDRQIIFEFKPEMASAGHMLQIRITLHLSVNYNYGAGEEPKQYTLQKEWPKTIQVHQAEPESGAVF